MDYFRTANAQTSSCQPPFDALQQLGFRLIPRLRGSHKASSSMTPSLPPSGGPSFNPAVYASRIGPGSASLLDPTQRPSTCSGGSQWIPLRAVVFD